DGIRDRNVTGVQTCALPICNSRSPALGAWSGALIDVTDDSRRNSGIPAPGATETTLALAVLARAAQKMRRRIVPRKFLGARLFPKAPAPARSWAFGKKNKALLRA